MDLTKLRETLSYNPCSGTFRWKRPTNRRIVVGSTAGHMRRDGYVVIRVDRKNYLASRLAWFYSYGKWPSIQIDHLDRDPRHNSIWNLRDATSKENMKNSRSYRDGLGETRKYRTSSEFYHRRKRMETIKKED